MTRTVEELMIELDAVKGKLDLVSSTRNRTSQPETDGRYGEYNLIGRRRKRDFTYASIRPGIYLTWNIEIIG